MTLSANTMNAIKQMGIDYEPAAIGIAHAIFSEYLLDVESVGGDADESAYSDYSKRLTRMFDGSEDIFLNPETSC